MIFAGAQPAATLTGLVTNDVVALRPGEGQFAGALTPKGKVIAAALMVAGRWALHELAEAHTGGWHIDTMVVIDGIQPAALHDPSIARLPAIDKIGRAHV